MINKFSFRQNQHFNWYIIFWISALVLAFYLYNQWHIDKSYIGIVEKKSFLIGAQEPGSLHKMLVSVGDQVKPGQVLALLDVSDLKTKLNQLQAELSTIQKLQGANQNRLSLMVQSMGLQLENEASELVDRLSLIESKSTELAGLNVEIERLQKAESAGLGYSRDMADLKLQRDALSAYLREQSKDLTFQSQKLEKVRHSRQTLEDADIDSLTKSLLLEKMEHTEELRRQIALTEHRIRLRTVISPCDGVVTELLARPGSVVDEFIPIISVEELKPGYLTIYIPERSTVQLTPGMEVIIQSPRSDDFSTTGVITFVHPGMSRAVDRIAFRGQIFWARKVRVELNKDHKLIPGEVVQTRITNHIDEHSLITQAAISAESTDDGNSPVKLQDMKISDALLNKSQFEPSGIAWIPEVKKYLIVSDDTGIKYSKNDHAPMLFFMDETGTVEPTPVVLAGINAVNDIEAVTSSNDGSYYLISSQNISKYGNRPKSREMILKIKWDGEKFIVLEQEKFLSLILKSYSLPERIALGLDRIEADGQPVLNIEGASFNDNAIYFGLKEPVSDKGAIIWKLDDIDSIFKTKSLKPDQLTVYGYVQLGTFKGKKSGFSDLIFDSTGKLWAVSTIADVAKEDQIGGFHRINQFANGHLEAERLQSFYGVKPEGIGFQNTNRFLIVFDNDGQIPSYCYIGEDVK